MQSYTTYTLPSLILNWPKCLKILRLTNTYMFRHHTFQVKNHLFTIKSSFTMMYNVYELIYIQSTCFMCVEGIKLVLNSCIREWFIYLQKCSQLIPANETFGWINKWIYKLQNWWISTSTMENFNIFLTVYLFDSVMYS